MLLKSPVKISSQTKISGWILDLYPSPHGMKLWLIEPNQTRHRLIDRFAPVFYVSGPDAMLGRLRDEIARQPHALACRTTERMDLWERRARPVLEIEVAHPNEYSSWTRWVRRFDSSLRLYNSDLMLASLYCWQRGVFPLARVEVEADGEGRVLAIECRDTEWAIDYEPPPLEILRIRLSGLKGIDPRHSSPFEQRAAIEIEVDGRQFELDEAGEPAAVAFQHLLARHDPDLILSDWGDATILPKLREQAAKLRLPLTLNRDASAEIHESRARSYMSYGRILFKNSATTLFGRLHVDTQNSFIADKCDLSGLWELAWRDGVLIPEQKAEPEDPKPPDELLLADRGGLVFTPKTGFHANVAELDFVSEYPNIMAKRNISPETVNCPCCPDAPRVPELGYRVCQRRRGITSRVVEKIIAKRDELKKCSARLQAGMCVHPKCPPEGGRYTDRPYSAEAEKIQRYKLQRDALKWLLVCCFGYTGYKNARFGKIEAHEAINAVARETLLVAKEIAENDGFQLIHALVDSIYVWKEGAKREDFERLAIEIETRTRLPLAIESVYRYVVFLPSKQYADVPVPNRFFAVGEDGELKVRGLECRRHDTAPLLKRMQHEVLAILAEAHDFESYIHKIEAARMVLADYQERLSSGDVDIRELIISKRITKEPRGYQKAGVTAIAAQQLFGSGVKLRPGQTVEYIITNSECSVPNDRVRAFALWEGWFGYDRKKYGAMLREAFEPFILCLPKTAEENLLTDSLTEDEVKRFPLFAALTRSRS